MATGRANRARRRRSSSLSALFRAINTTRSTATGRRHYTAAALTADGHLYIILCIHPSAGRDLPGLPRTCIIIVVVVIIITVNKLWRQQWWFDIGVYPLYAYVARCTAVYIACSSRTPRWTRRCELITRESLSVFNIYSFESR